jgi:signal peptidase II
MQAARGTPLTGPAAAGGSPGASGASTQGTPGASGAAQPAANRPAAQNRRRIGVLLAVAVLVLAIDIASKALVVAHLADRQIHLLGGFLTLRESRNPGAAFSLGTSLTLMYSAIAVAVIVVILRTSRRIRSLPWAITLGLLLGGATGNLMDRIFRSPGLFRGWVVDWIQVPHWPVFNLADSAIVCGGILAVLLSARGTRLDGRRD